MSEDNLPLEETAEMEPAMEPEAPVVEKPAKKKKKRMPKGLEEKSLKGALLAIMNHCECSMPYSEFVAAIEAKTPIKPSNRAEILKIAMRVAQSE